MSCNLFELKKAIKTSNGGKRVFKKKWKFYLFSSSVTIHATAFEDARKEDR